MIQLRTKTRTQTTTAIPAEAFQQASTKRQVYWGRIGFCLLLACIGASWFAYQYILVPQPTSFSPPWRGAQWIQAVDGNTPVAYFRYNTNLSAIPDAAFVTVAASQSFRLYVNGFLIGSNATDITQGSGSRAYIFDIVSTLHTGSNVVALRIANMDQQPALLRATLGLVQGSSTGYYGSNTGWHATTQSVLVYHRYTSDSLGWTTAAFDDSAWQEARVVSIPSMTPQLDVNPLLYKQPLPVQWMSVGVSHDGYFVRTVNLPAGITGTWLRVVATGPTEIFINGHLSLVWNGQASVPPQQLSSYLSDQVVIPQYQNGLLLGIYDVSPYFHAGGNTIAIHVSSPGSATAQEGLETLNSAISLDMLTSDMQGHNSWLRPDLNWHVSSQAVAGWESGNITALSWPSPFLLGRPGVSRTLYLPSTPTPRNVLIPSFPQLGLMVLFCSGLVLGLWLFISLFVLRRYYPSLIDTFEKGSLAYLPALACEGLLVALAREPQIPRPFPYTWQWGLLLLAFVGIGYLLVWLAARKAVKRARGGRLSLPEFEPETPLPPSWDMETPMPPSLAGVQRLVSILRGYTRSWLCWLWVHWALLLIVLLSAILICYNLNYEPYWQDEITSYYAAKGILAHGLPLMPSGFLYLKAELYSYLLALSIAFFGEQNGALRFLTVAEYLISLPVLYGVACYMFNRRIAIMATATLAFSPSTLLWGHEVRMYEQAQLFTILDMYLFYRALQQPEKAGRIYLAVACLIATYLSHEETFIVLPSLVLCVVITSRDAAHRLPVVFYQKHWWFASIAGAGLIGLQLLLSKVTHPPLLGTDQSQQPLIQFTTENASYYLKLFFHPIMLNASLPWLGLNALLAIVGCFLAVYRLDKPAIYCGLFFIASLVTLIFLFTLTSDRYIYPILPAFYLIGAYALLQGLKAIQALVRSCPVPRQNECMVYTSGGSPPLPLRILMAAIATLVCACVLIVPFLPISNANLFVSRQFGALYHRHYPDYDAINQYMQQHWHKGDVVVAVSPAISVLYYVGHVDYFFSLDRALYLFERSGGITDTPTGTIPLLSQADFQALLATHARIWIVSDNGLYQADVLKNGRFVFPTDFSIVSEGYGSALYFRGGQ